MSVLHNLTALNFLAVGAGAAVGAWARWLLGLALNPLFIALPLGTLAANVVGGYLVGVAVGLMVPPCAAVATRASSVSRSAPISPAGSVSAG